MQIKLIKLIIENFKGIRSFILNTDGKNTNIHGDNATGKTTLIDAFLWLLFDKNSDGKKDFTIKTMVNDEALHNLNHSVSCVFDIDGEPLELKKVYYEKYTKKRGQITAEFTGHTTDYFVDGVPASKKEYDENIKSIIDEETFKTITSVHHFANMEWKKRRDMVMKIVGEPSIDDILKHDPTVKDAVAIKDIEGRKKILDANRKEINKAIDGIPVRIDELYKQIVDVETHYTETDRDSVQADIDEISSRIANMTVDAERQKIEYERNDLVVKLATIGREIKSFNDFKSDFDHRKQQNIDGMKGDINELKDSNNVLRTRRKGVFETSPDVETTCPTCGQIVPEEKRQAAIEQFNLQKASDLALIDSHGRENKAKIEELTAMIGQAEGQDALEFYGQEVPTVEQADALKFKIAALDEKIKNSVNEEMEKARLELENERSEARQLLVDINQALAKKNAAIATESRIKELESEQRELSRQFGEVEKELNLIERFTRAKMTLVQNRVEGRFRLAKFKMFETQINGGIADACEITGPDGVPYADLNNAMKINVGIDICNVISENIGITAPIFVDNAESVTSLIESGSQIIRLVVDGECKELTIK